MLTMKHLQFMLRNCATHVTLQRATPTDPFPALFTMATLDRQVYLAKAVHRVGLSDVPMMLTS